MSISTAGWMLSFTQIIGLPFSFIAPYVAGKFKSQYGIALLVEICSVIGFAGLIMVDSLEMSIVCCIFLSVTLNGGFALAMALIGLRTKTATQASHLSGMSQSIGYSLAAIGPVIIGFIFNMTSSWFIPLLVLLISGLLAALFGILSGRNIYVSDAH